MDTVCKTSATGNQVGMHSMDISAAAHAHTEEVAAYLQKHLAGFDFGFTVSDPSQPDNPVIYASSRFYDITGYGPDEVLGRNCRFLQGPATSRRAVSEMRDAQREERACQVCLLNYRKDGSPFWNQIYICPVRDASGQVLHYVGIQTDVTQQVERGHGGGAQGEQLCSQAVRAAPLNAQAVHAAAAAVLMPSAGTATTDSAVGSTVEAVEGPHGVDEPSPQRMVDGGAAEGRCLESNAGAAEGHGKRLEGESKGSTGKESEGKREGNCEQCSRDDLITTKTITATSSSTGSIAPTSVAAAITPTSSLARAIVCAASASTAGDITPAVSVSATADGNATGGAGSSASGGSSSASSTDAAAAVSSAGAGAAGAPTAVIAAGATSSGNSSFNGASVAEASAVRATGLSVVVVEGVEEQGEEGVAEVAALEEQEAHQVEVVLQAEPALREEPPAFCPRLPCSLRQALMEIQWPFVLSDLRLPGCPIVHASHAFLRLTGYTSKSQVLGRNCRFLQGPGTDPHELARLRAALTSSPPRPVTVTLLNYRKDGSTFWNALHVAPVRDAEGQVVYLVGVQMEVPPPPPGAAPHTHAAPADLVNRSASTTGSASAAGEVQGTAAPGTADAQQLQQEQHQQQQCKEQQQLVQASLAVAGSAAPAGGSGTGAHAEAAVIAAAAGAASTATGSSSAAAGAARASGAACAAAGAASSAAGAAARGAPAAGPGPLPLWVTLCHKSVTGAVRVAVRALGGATRGLRRSSDDQVFPRGPCASRTTSAPVERTAPASPTASPASEGGAGELGRRVDSMQRQDRATQQVPTDPRSLHTASAPAALDAAGCLTGG